MPSSSKSKEAPPPVRVKVEPQEEVEMSPQPLPVIRTADNTRILPRYAAVLTKSQKDGVGFDDLEVLQLEMENLLSCVALRHRALLEEIGQTESAEEKRDRKSKVVATKPVTSTPTTLKRGPTKSDDRPSKKTKESGKPDFLPSAGKLSKVKAPPDYPSRDSPKPDAPKIVANKNDTSNKFWASVEPYCGQITPDDMAYLSDLIRIREEERHSDIYTIPPLGKHYTIQWAEDDLGEDTKRPQQLGGTAGAMTQRLVSALVEEKTSPIPDGSVNRELSSSRSAAVRHVQSLSFERRVREELREQGILDGDEAPKEQADDELLLEMKRVQSELKALSSHNLQRLRHLQSLADAQVERQELKKKLLVIDTELLNIYKQKRKDLTEKEREQAWRYIKQREALVKQLYPNSAS